MKRIVGWTLGLMLVGGGLASTSTRAEAADLKVGDAAPDFKLQGTDGKTHSLSDMRGKTVILAWFPKAFTGG